MQDEQEYVRIEAAAAMFGVSRATVYEWIKKGIIKKYQRGMSKAPLYVKPEEIRAAREMRPADENGDE